MKTDEPLREAGSVAEDEIEAETGVTTTSWICASAFPVFLTSRVRELAVMLPSSVSWLLELAAKSFHHVPERVRLLPTCRLADATLSGGTCVETAVAEKRNPGDDELPVF